VENTTTKLEDLALCANCHRMIHAQKPLILVGALPPRKYHVPASAGLASTWKKIAAEIKTPYEFREYDYDFAGLLNAVERNEVDAAIAAIQMTTEG